jgi:hypothetical protein
MCEVIGGSLKPRSLTEYTGHLIQASKELNSTDDVTAGGLYPIRHEGFYSFLFAVYLFLNVFFDNFVSF